jgi:RsiW-degrading membrane proteinase PrsW (M82 family)
MREVAIACPRIVVVMWRRIFVSIMPREMPLIVVVGGFVLTMMLALFVVIMMSIVVDGRPFVEFFIMPRVRSRWNRAVA